jgi:uncharacterized DUF497 family protein
VANVISGEFEWDSTKAESNVRKHGVTFEEAAGALADLNSVEIADAIHPENTITLAMSPHARVLYIVTTLRDNDRTRIISARKATKHEERIY